MSVFEGTAALDESRVLVNLSNLPDGGTQVVAALNHAASVFTSARKGGEAHAVTWHMEDISVLPRSWERMGNGNGKSLFETTKVISLDHPEWGSLGEGTAVARLIELREHIETRINRGIATPLLVILPLVDGIGDLRHRAPAFAAEYKALVDQCMATPVPLPNVTVAATTTRLSQVPHMSRFTLILNGGPLT